MSTKSYIFCPVSEKRINERVARLNGLFTVFLIIVFVATQNIIPLGFLAADFFLRAFELSRFSPLAVTSGRLVSYLNLNKQIINAGPKIFAARIGFSLSSLAVVSFLLNFHAGSFALAGILGVFSFLEGAFGICVACEIYPFLYRLLYKVRFGN
jgi:hypothetical protein